MASMSLSRSSSRSSFLNTVIRNFTSAIHPKHCAMSSMFFGVRCEARICVNTSSAFFRRLSTFFNASSIFSGLTRFLPLKTFTISSKASLRGLSTAKKSSACRVLFSTNNRALTANFMMFFSKSSAFFWEFDSAFTICFRAVSSAVVSSLRIAFITFFS